jgi:hypothetical protein
MMAKVVAWMRLERYALGCDSTRVLLCLRWTRFPFATTAFAVFPFFASRAVGPGCFRKKYRANCLGSTAQLSTGAKLIWDI